VLDLLNQNCDHAFQDFEVALALVTIHQMPRKRHQS